MTERRDDDESPLERRLKEAAGKTLFHTPKRLDEARAAMHEAADVLAECRRAMAVVLSRFGTIGWAWPEDAGAIDGLRNAFARLERSGP